MALPFALVAPEWRMTAAYLLVLGPAAALMKVLSVAVDSSVYREPLAERVRFLLLAPVFSTDTWRSSARELRLLGGAACVAGLAAYLVWAKPLLAWSGVPPVWLAFAAAIPLWLLVGSVGFAGQCAGLALGRRLESIHDRPYAARSLAEFWGRRWNRWTGAWLRQVCFRRFRRRPMLGVVTAFGASAALHELLVAVPAWLVLRRMFAGQMTVYFALQAAGVALERRWMRGRSDLAGRLWTWTWVLAPLPLVLNEASRAIFRFA